MGTLRRAPVTLGRGLRPANWPLWLAVLATVSALAGAGLWFKGSHLHWFGEHVTDINAWQAEWQTWIDGQPQLDHPAMIHLMPRDCLCRFFTAGHATDLSRRGRGMGYRVFQAGDQFLDPDLARPMDIAPDRIVPGPLIALTGADGALRYLGPYSDGIRCTDGTSLVDQWLPPDRAGRAVTLDVDSCRCG